MCAKDVTRPSRMKEARAFRVDIYNEKKKKNVSKTKTIHTTINY